MLTSAKNMQVRNLFLVCSIAALLCHTPNILGQEGAVLLSPSPAKPAKQSPEAASNRKPTQRAVGVARSQTQANAFVQTQGNAASKAIAKVGKRSQIEKTTSRDIDGRALRSRNISSRRVVKKKDDRVQRHVKSTRPRVATRHNSRTKQTSVHSFSRSQKTQLQERRREIIERRKREIAERRKRHEQHVRQVRYETEQRRTLVRQQREERARQAKIRQAQLAQQRQKQRNT